MTNQTPQTNDEQSINEFDNFGLSPIIVNSLKAMGYTEPTPIQREAIPLILDGHDLMGLAQTGTGKTAAFGLPLVQQLMGAGSKPYPKTIRALILSPTRELANQIAENLKMYVKNTHLRVTTVVGGQSINVQQKALGRGNDVLVATPGRLLDLVERKAVILDSAKYLVLDEADQMLDLGFIHALKKISKMVAKERQTLLFSATMPKEIADLAKAFLKDPVRIEVAPPGKAADKVTQSVYYVGQRAKPDLLKTLLAARPDDLSLVFSRTKHGAEKLMKILSAEGFAAGSIHGNKSQGQRDRAIRDFKSGAIRVLVATDVAARGIDISGVSHVYNFDLPEVPANYVHRIGRTARAGAQGEAIAFCSPEEAHLLSAIEKMMGIKVEIVGGSMTEEERRAGAQIAKEMRQGRGRGGRGGAGKGGGQAHRSRNQPGARRGTPERGAGRKGLPKKQYDNTSSEPDPFASDVPRDDFAKVKAAGFSGKPNSKKNKKRFGNFTGDGAGQKQGTGNSQKSHSAKSSDGDGAKPNANKSRNKPNRNSRPGKRPAQANTGHAAGRGGSQGRKRKPSLG